MRNFNTFSEFQLGLVYTLSEVSALRVVDTFGSLIRLIDPDTDEILFEWQYGQDPMLRDAECLVPMTDFVDTLTDLVILYKVSREATDILTDFADELEDWMFDDDEDNDNG